MNAEHLATAHQTWDANWTSPEERVRWLTPETSVQAVVPLLRERGFQRVLDVGCGVGRHAQYLASEGFTCTGIDASEAGLDFARRAAQATGVHVEYRSAPFYRLPFEERSFDALIAWNVIYHGDREVAQRAIAEFARVLVPGGLYLGTMLSQRNTGFGIGREVSQDTFVVDGATDDKVHPHLYLSGLDVLALHRDFEVLALQDVAQSPGHWHWSFTFERR
jgi:2-polyprenyl-3-methyl-5-hydroxy-6-metoxy-1,4-benzoquinol methylase